MYDNPRHKKEQIVKARLDYYDDTEFRKLASQLRMQPAVLARHLIKQFISEAKAQQSATTSQRSAV